MPDAQTVPTSDVKFSRSRALTFSPYAVADRKVFPRLIPKPFDFQFKSPQPTFLHHFSVCLSAIADARAFLASDVIIT